MLHYGKDAVCVLSHTTGAKRSQSHSILASFVLALLIIAGAQITQAQTYKVLHDFTGQQDGASPVTGVTLGADGNLYGTTFGGGAGFGTIYMLDPPGPGWTFSLIYSFQGGSDGAGPFSELVIGPNGAFYGTTSAGGSGCGQGGCGTVFELTPPRRAPSTAVVNWSDTVLHSFSGSDGAYPQGELTFDQAGNIYGTTVNGGNGWGTIYSLTRSGGGWSGNVLYRAQNRGDGQYPWGGVTFDQAGNLYGVFSGGGPRGYGAVYELSPSGSGWTESTVHAFSFSGNDGATPQGHLIVDQSGNIYGATVHSATGGGTAFELTKSDGGWSYNFLYGFNGGIDLGPYDRLTMDSAGNLYGTTFGDGRYGAGSVFQLTRSGGGWTYKSLHDFSGGADGGNPVSSLTLDSAGNIYGTASDGGAYNKGVVFQITP